MSESTTPRRYGLKHAVVVEVWELHEQALRDALMEKARRLSTEGGYAQPPDDLEIDVIPRRWAVAELARVVAELGRKVDALTSPNRPAPAVTHIHGRIDRLAARVNQLEADAAKPSPLHQAIADEIRRAAGIR